MDKLSAATVRCIAADQHCSRTKEGAAATIPRDGQVGYAGTWDESPWSRRSTLGMGPRTSTCRLRRRRSSAQQHDQELGAGADTRQLGGTCVSSRLQLLDIKRTCRLDDSDGSHQQRGGDMPPGAWGCVGPRPFSLI
jgi:hypothetical protein